MASTFISCFFSYGMNFFMQFSQHCLFSYETIFIQFGDFMGVLTFHGFFTVNKTSSAISGPPLLRPWTTHSNSQPPGLQWGKMSPHTLVKPSACLDTWLRLNPQSTSTEPITRSAECRRRRREGPDELSGNSILQY